MKNGEKEAVTAAIGVMRSFLSETDAYEIAWAFEVAAGAKSVEVMEWMAETLGAVAEITRAVEKEIEEEEQDKEGGT